MPVGTGLGRERREVGMEEEGMLTFTQTLSKNVTRILEELLMGYDQTERPPSKGQIGENIGIFQVQNMSQVQPM